MTDHALLALCNVLQWLQAWRFTPAQAEHLMVIIRAQTEGQVTAARVEPQDCGLSANDIYHVMLAWEQQPASDEQTRIVTGLGKLREQFIQLGDSPYVTVPATARVEPPVSIFAIDDWTTRIERAIYSKIGNTFTPDQIARLHLVVEAMLQSKATS